MRRIVTPLFAFIIFMLGALPFVENSLLVRVSSSHHDLLIVETATAAHFFVLSIFSQLVERLLSPGFALQGLVLDARSFLDVMATDPWHGRVAHLFKALVLVINLTIMKVLNLHFLVPLLSITLGIHLHIILYLNDVAFGVYAIAAAFD